MKKLYSGFDLCAPIHLGVDDHQRPGADDPGHVHEHRHRPARRAYLRDDRTLERRVEAALAGAGTGGAAAVPRRAAAGPRRLGLGLLGMQRAPDWSKRGLLTRRGIRKLRAEALTRVRGTVQADILKEDQAQNTCIFSTEFALRMMGDVQQFFIDNDVRNFYSVSISGYHIAEAGANPITQLAFTLAQRLHHRRVLPRARHEDRRLRAEPVVLLLERHGRGVRGDRPRRAPHLGARDARRLRRRRAQPDAEVPHPDLGPSAARAEIQFNDIRTTLQAMYALFDNCNSLHTNAYDEALTTPTEESVRRAVAIQLIINRELGPQQHRESVAGLLRHRRS